MFTLEVARNISLQQRKGRIKTYISDHDSDDTENYDNTDNYDDTDNYEDTDNY